MAVPPYNGSHRCGPLVEVAAEEILAEARKKNLLWIPVRLHAEEKQEASGWAGFNISVCSKVQVSQDVIRYLPTIDAPATDMATVQEVLVLSLKIKSTLKLKSIVLVFDQTQFPPESYQREDGGVVGGSLPAPHNFACHLSVFQNVIGYLPTIDAPANDIATVHEVLVQSLKIKSTLKLKSIVLLFDQTLYAKATEVQWKQSERFKDILLRVRVFQTAYTLLSIIGKRFQDAVLRDLCVGSDVIAEGSVAEVLDGRRFNRGVRLHKLMYEALMRRLATIRGLDTGKSQGIQDYC